MYAKCFYYKARRRMQNAQILVVNHALFFTDLALRRENVSILPKYDVVIFDEAHTIEAVAGDHLGLSITNGQVEYTLRKLYNDRTNRGLLVHHKLGDAQKEVWECRDRAERFLRERGRVAGRAAEGQRPGPPAGHRRQPAERRAAKARRHAAAARPSRSNSPSSGRTSPPRPTGWRRLPRASTTGWASRLPDSVYWIDRGFSRSRLRITLAAAPIDVGPVLREHLFAKVPTVDHDQRHAGHRRRQPSIDVLRVARRAQVAGQSFGR